MGYCNYWIDNHTVEGCIKHLVLFLDGMTRGAVFCKKGVIGEFITDFYDNNPHFFNFMDDIYVEYIEHENNGQYWYSDIDAKEYEDE